MTPEQIDAALALCDAATDGPWKFEGSNGEWEMWSEPFDVNGFYVHVVEDHQDYPPLTVADGRFIAAARTGWPEALHALQRVLALHQPHTLGSGLTYCKGCAAWDDYADHPCATVRAITGGTE